jgi:hypothetical protein
MNKGNDNSETKSEEEQIQNINNDIEELEHQINITVDEEIKKNLTKKLMSLNKELNYLLKKKIERNK